jgi:hypothetical protein
VRGAEVLALGIRATAEPSRNIRAARTERKFTLDFLRVYARRDDVMTFWGADRVEA